MYTIFQQTFVYILYTNTKCTQNEYKMFVYKMQPTFRQTLYTFCIQNLADIVLLILYTKCIQKLVEMWYTFCMPFVYISCIHLVQFLYTKCMHSFRVGLDIKL